MVVGIRHTSSATSTVIVTGVPGLRHLDAVERIGQQGHRGEQENECHRHQQDGQRDLVRRLLALGAFDHPDHAVEECFAGIHVDAHDDPVREHASAAGHGVEVASRGANDRSALAGDRAFVDRRCALDHLAVAGDEVTLYNENDIALAQAVRRHRHLRGVALRLGELFRDRVPAGALQRRRLRLAASLGDGLGEVGEQQRYPQPQRHGENEPGRRFALAEDRLHPEYRRQDAADVDDEHHWIPPLVARREPEKAVAKRALHQVRIDEPGQASLPCSRSRHDRFFRG